MSSVLSLYVSDVMHRRRFPQDYRFDYKVFSFLIDIDQIKEGSKTPLISFNRFNIFSIYTKDHGSRDGTDWRVWINSVLDKESLSKAKHKVKLLCFPRILGYGFNPLSLWYCYGEDGQIYAIICEVRNTFGEHHHYVLHNNNQPYESKIKANKDKYFHVSPFVSMDAEYQFILGAPDDNLSIVINEYQNQKLMLTASQVGRKIPVTTSQLVQQFFRLPLMTFKIMAMIHWQALRIWLRGGTYHKKPKAPEEDFT
jgi:hypothetical protein